MKVALFVTCLVDLVRPEIGFSTIKLLEQAGCTVEVPDAQTCCGQPAYNSGDAATARALALRLLETFERYDHVVVPSGSCAATVKGDYVDMFRDDPDLRARFDALAGRTHELTDFLVNVCKVETLESRFPFGRYSQQAMLELAYSQWKDVEPLPAVATLDRFLKLYPTHPSADYAWYLRGLINFNHDLGFLGFLSRQDVAERDPRSARESFDSFRELVTRFPESRYAPDAAARMKFIVNMLASNEIHVARFYLRKGAFVAAANRAQTALTT
jgi:hypothetical protein